MLSIVIPSFNEEGNIEKTASVIRSLLDENGIDHELIFVDDGSTDKTWQIISDCNLKDGKIRGVRLSRHFGKEGGILAGLGSAKGDAAVVIDCDLQHPPETIIEMHKLWLEGTDVVEGKKSSRGKESRIYGGFSKIFYSLIQSAAGIDMKDASDFKLIDRKVIDAILELPERITFFRALTGWVGFETKTVYYDVRKREIGSGKWSFRSLVGYAIRNLTSFTGLPLYFSTFIGSAVILTSIVLFILLACGIELGSFNAATIVLMLIGGLILECIGMSSYYISRVYEETKHRPRFIVAKTTETRAEERK